MTLGILAGGVIILPYSLRLFLILVFVFITIALYKTKSNDKWLWTAIAILFINAGLLISTPSKSVFQFELIQGKEIRGILEVLDEGVYRNFRYLYEGQLKEIAVYGQKAELKGQRIYVYSSTQLHVPSLIEFDGYIRIRKGKIYLYIRDIYKQSEVKRHFAKLRINILQRIDKTYPSPAKEFVKAIIFGRRAQLDYSIVAGFRRTGLIHLLAISGLHIGILFFVFRIFFAFLAPFSRFIRDALVLILLFVYIKVINLPLSAVRAFLMISVLVVTYHLNRVYNPLNGLGVAYFILIVFKPDIIYNIGFQMSFIATLSIILFFQQFKKIVKSNIVAATLSAQVLILPLVIYYFKYVPLFFIISNVLLVPVFSFILGLSILSIIFSFFNINGIIPVLNYIVAFFIKTVVKMGEWHYSYLPIVKVSIFFVIFYYTGILLLRIKRKKIVALSFIVLAFLTFFFPTNKNEIVFFNQISPFVLMSVEGEGKYIIDVGCGKHIDGMINYVSSYYSHARVITGNANIYLALKAVGFKGGVLYKKEGEIKFINSVIKINKDYVEITRDRIKMYFIKKATNLVSPANYRKILFLLNNRIPIPDGKYDLILFSKSCILEDANINYKCLDGLDAVLRIEGANFSIKEKKIWQNI